MASKLAFIISALYLVSLFCSSSGQKPGRYQHDYDFLLLSVNWSPTVCREIVNSGSEVNCSPCNSPKAVNKWRIHGLWPSRHHGTGPFQCSNVPFDPALFSGELKAALERKWPSLNFNSEHKFWSHEWEKHGTCVSNLKGQSEYFSKTIQLFDQFNVGKILDDARMMPEANYQLGDIHRVFKNSLGVNVFVACKRDRKSNLQFLSEIRLCFNKLFQLIDCDGKAGLPSNCMRGNEIMYLKSC